MRVDLFGKNVDKIMTARLPEDGQNSDNQGQAYEKLTTHE